MARWLAKVPAPAGWIPYAAALLCVAAAITCAFYLAGPVSSYAAGDDAWKGNVTVVEKSDDEHVKTNVTGQETVRFHWTQTAVYSDLRLQWQALDIWSSAWKGTTNVKLTFNETNYFVTSSDCEESGKDLTATASTVLPGQVLFFKPNPQNICQFTAEPANNNGEEWQAFEVGHEWMKCFERRCSCTPFDNPVRQPLTLHMVSADPSFACDPKAAAYSGQKDLRELGDSYHRTVTWYFSTRPVDTEAVIIPPDNYGSWQPEAGADEDTPGNIMPVKVRIQKKGQPGSSIPHTAKFKFELVDVSKELGVCLNWPSKINAKSTFDLKIQQEKNPSLHVTGDGQIAESEAGLKESQIVITSYDWGAYGTLKVTAVYEDGHQDEAHVQTGGSKSAASGGLKIPQDENGNHIADSWEKSYYGDKSATADDDETPSGDGDTGDGLSLYEEYRGFRVQGAHIRTNPLVKDVFIWDEDNLGKGYFAQSGLASHLVDIGEFSYEGSGSTNTMVINGNRGFGTRGPQHALRLGNKDMPGLLGLANGGPGVPKKILMVQIDVARCLKYGAQQLASTIAHELAHACNVWHHGDTDYDTSDAEDLQDEHWAPIKSGNYTVAADGGQESGVQECIMRYHSATFYENPAGDFRWLNGGVLQRGFSYPPREPPGTIFCYGTEGTGVNAPGRAGGSKAGNATRGKCRYQFCVNDNKH